MLNQIQHFCKQKLILFIKYGLKNWIFANHGLQNLCLAFSQNTHTLRTLKCYAVDKIMGEPLLRRERSLLQSFSWWCLCPTLDAKVCQKREERKRDREREETKRTCQ